MAVMPNKPTLITHAGYKYLILDAPTDQNLPLYIREFEKNGVKHVVRVCNSSYSVRSLESKHIDVHSLPFDDGQPPPNDVIGTWLELVERNHVENPDGAIAVHCVAGLGRAPVLVAVAMIEHGSDALGAVEDIRRQRRGAINQKQIEFLEKYRPRKKGKKGGADGKDGCLVL